MSMTSTRQATVATIVLSHPLGGLDATLRALDAQVYEQVGVVVVGDSVLPEASVSGRRVVKRSAIGDVMAKLPEAVTHIWFVREGATPRPDAAGALLADMDRTDASIGGSKIVTSPNDRLVSVGLVTDVFGVPYTGMDAGERDQGQYDVVRDVAAVTGVSMMVRRDLLAGLGGIDEALTPMEAAVDLSQRARLKGARTIVSPASVVDYAGDLADGSGWREDASRIRMMLKTYGPLTLLWTVPLDFIIGLVVSIVSIFLGRWLVFDLFRAWGWNLWRLPSTFGARRQARAGRVAGDADLFRFQRRGSVKASVTGQATAAALRKRLPGDDRLSVESIGNDVRQPAVIVGVMAVIFVLLSARNIWADGLPSVGFTLPFPIDGWDALVGYAGGWNPAGLGSPDSLRPLLAITGLAKVVTLDSATLAEYALTAGSMLAGIWGVTRLLRTWSIAAAPALVAGVVYIAGPTAQGIAGNTHIGTTIALGVLPWALRMCLAPVGNGLWPGVVRISAVILVFGVTGALSPLLLLVIGPALLAYALFSFTEERAWRAVILALVGTAGAGLLLSPWIWSANFMAIAKAGYAYWNISPVLAVAGAVVALAAVGAGRSGLGVVAGWGALLAAAGFLGSRSGFVGLGVETESVSLAIAGLGLAIVISVVADSVFAEGFGTARRFALGVGIVGVILLVVGSLPIIIGGRAGLPGDVHTEALRFTLANEGEAERSRVLLVGDPQLLPGNYRLVRGGAYRVVSATGPDLGEARLAPELPFDDLLETKLESIIDGETRRAGGELASFGIRWILVMGDSSGSDTQNPAVAWRNVFAGQLDLLPLSSSTGNATFVSDVDPIGRALTSGLESWARIGWTYQGEPDEGHRVFVAENADPGWGPPPNAPVGNMNEVAAGSGVITYASNTGQRNQSLGVVAAIIMLTSLVVVGRRLQ